MAADGSIVIDTKIDDSGVPKQLSKMKTSLAKAAKTLALPIAITAGAIAAVGKVVSLMGELNKIYMVQASAERALSQAAANNPYLTGESVNNLKRYASELQKVSNYGDEVTIGLMTQLAAAGRTESEIKSIIKASADLAASGTTTFDGAVKNLNKTYSGLSGELGEVIPELKTLTAEQMKNGDAVDLIAKKYDGMALSVVDKSTQMHNATGDLKEQIGRGLSPVVDEASGFFGTLAGKIAEALQAANDWRDAQKAEADGTETNAQILSRLNGELGDLTAKTAELEQKASTPFLGAYYKDALIKSQLLVQAKEKEIKKITDQMTAEEKQKALQLKTAQEEEEAAIKRREIAEAETKQIEKQIEGRIAAQEQYDTAVKLATEKQKGGLITLEEKWEDIKKAAERYTDALIILGYTYDETGTKGGQALDEMRRKLTGVDLSSGLGINISGIKMPMGIFDTFVDNAAELGDDWGKQLTGSMASSIDNTSIGVSESIGAVMDNIGAAITIAIAVVKKIFAGIKKVATFDPAELYKSFEDIIKGLTKFFAKVGSISSYIEAGRKVLGEFMRGMLENKETNMETFRNVLKYMIESAKEVLPAVISFAFIMMTDMATAIISQLPLIIDTAFAIITALAVGILDSLPALILAAGDILPALLYSIITGIPMFYLTVIEHLPEIITAIINAVIGMLPELTMAIIQAWIQTMYIMPSLMIAALVGLLLEVVVNLITDIYTLFTPAGAAIWEGIWQGIKDGWAKFAEDVRKAFKSIGDMFKSIFEINSPSKVFGRYGVNLMEGLKNAILGYDLWGKISSKFTELRGKVSNALSGIKDTASKVSTSVGDWFKGLFNAEGTNNFRGGTAIINEEGAEMVTLPSGSKIMTASATAQMQDRAISQLLSGMRMPSFATAGGGGSRNVMISTKVDAPLMIDGAVLGRLVFQNIDRAVV